MVAGLVKSDLGQIVLFDQRFLSVFFKVSREDEMLISVGEQSAYGIIVFRLSLFVLILLIQHRHCYACAELEDLSQLYAVCRCVMVCACCYLSVALADVI